MIVIILSSLVLTNVNCQLAHLWLNYQHFQCAQNIRSYHEAVQHQYLCVSSLTWKCVRDVNVYTRGSALSLDYFCGFINGQNAKQSHTIWNIHVRPNIHVHFLKFSLFNNYWYCDVEYLKVTTTNKSSTFCGYRLPWIHDASDVAMNIKLSMDRFSSVHYQVELQYHGAYIQNYQDFVVFMEFFSTFETHVPDIMQNKFESFHFISNKLAVLHFRTVKMCSKMQLVCHDGPGIKSPTLQFICSNYSICEYRSSTFQMYCKFSVSDSGCLNVPKFHYRATYAKDEKFNSIGRSYEIMDGWNLRVRKLQISETVSSGTHKYRYEHFENINPNNYFTSLTINKMSISFPYMMYEGYSCMYGGIYIELFSTQSPEILSHCDPTSTVYREGFFFNRQRIIIIIIIHYMEYSGPTIIFEAEIKDIYGDLMLPLDKKFDDNKGVNITLPHNHDKYTFYLQPMLHRNIKNIYITFETEHIRAEVKFDTWNSDSCIYCTLVYPPHKSNIRGRQYDVEVWNKASMRRDIIQSVTIDTSSCNASIINRWLVSIRLNQFVEDEGIFEGINTIVSTVLSGFVLWKQYKLQEAHSTGPFWYMVHMIKPADIPPYAIWRVWMEACTSLSHVAIEVPTDKHLSTSVYKWNHYDNSYNVYMTIDVAVNLLFESDNITTQDESCQDVFKVWFRRHFVNDYRITQCDPGETRPQSFFTFHKLR